jgi:hypothetical protein
MDGAASAREVSWPLLAIIVKPRSYFRLAGERAARHLLSSLGLPSRTWALACSTTIHMTVKSGRRLGTAAGAVPHDVIASMGQRLVAQTLLSERDRNDARGVVDGLPDTKTGLQVVRLAAHPIEWQSGKYDHAHVVEDRQEARRCDAIDTKPMGPCVEPRKEEPDRGNIVDLMAAP